MDDNITTRYLGFSIPAHGQQSVQSSWLEWGQAKAFTNTFIISSVLRHHRYLADNISVLSGPWVFEFYFMSYSHISELEQLCCHMSHVFNDSLSTFIPKLQYYPSRPPSSNKPTDLNFYIPNNLFNITSYSCQNSPSNFITLH